MGYEEGLTWVSCMFCRLSNATNASSKLSNHYEISFEKIDLWRKLD
jgi:hypothetical protein